MVERLVTRPDDLDTQRHDFPCGQLMVRRPSTASFSVKGLNAANHYGLKS